MMLSSIFALGSSVSWGTADFLGGAETRRFGAIRTSAWSQSITLVLAWVCIAAMIALDAIDIQARTVLLGAIGGAIGAVGLMAFYRALAIGPMAVVPPIAATGVAIPVLVGLSSGAPASRTVQIGLLLAVIGIILASAGESKSASSDATSIGLGVLALCGITALSFAAIFLLIDEAVGTSVSQAVLATASVRIGGVIAVMIAAVITTTNVLTGVGGRDAVRIARIGILDSFANLGFAIATTKGELEIVAVLASLYPAVTTLLAMFVFHERIGRLQATGMVIALIAVALLTV
jgi:drug/metabolite transporter (DMT)-like permease